jgi:hypothetical protein
MAFLFNQIPIEYHFKFEQCMQNIKNKPNLTLGLAAAVHEQLQLLTEYIYCHENRHGDSIIIETMLDSFIALTYHLSLRETTCALTEFGMIRNFNMYARCLTNPNPAIGIPTQEQAIEYGILNKEDLMTFYNIDECVYRPYSPSNLASAYEIFNSTEIKQEPIEYVILD